ncbi:LOW QUALITY PROTEIN: cyclic nucleotide-binding domain-containing protein 2 [Dromiciops gliroides]|uniref:LOW QUALITY PROTEIN: cyclic nucleotide-binding domain-containing protein 2 n=1 Tax=Dromiciops gliroides TaxID=33562 RepID=UPI001CC33E06|nr:LOW QUALITY PROTEIN: cyclic nucleotide-binding domain-containing protein 2 [Dromiciops gliroides]
MGMGEQRLGSISGDNELFQILCSSAEEDMEEKPKVYIWGTWEEKSSNTLQKPFHRFIKEIITMIRVCKIFRRGLHGFRECQIMQTTDKGNPIFSAWDKKKQTKLTFNYNEFFFEQGHFPQRAIQITQKRPEWREESEVYNLCNFLQVLESFWSYSQQLQLLLAKVIRYERFGRRRVIIKKGHKGNSFYFIYLGTVAVTADDDGSSAFLDAHPELLYKGSSFGEMALLTGSERIATVVCMEDTELLVVDKEDFFGNKMDEEVKKEFQFRFNFFREHNLFKTWSDESLKKVASYCKVEKFPLGQLITRNVTESGFIMFVTEGLCDIIRLLDLSTCLSYYKWIWQHLTPVDHSLLDARNFESSPRKRFKDFQLKSYPVLDFSNLKMAHLEKIRQEEKSDSPKEDKCTNSQNKYFRIGSGSCPVSSPMVMTEFGPLPKDAVVGVYVKVHTVESGNILGLHQHLIPDNLQDKRSWILVSRGATIIRFKKDIFDEFLDAETKGKLKELEIAYPSDNTMCQKILRENSWNIFRKDLLKILTKFPPYEMFTAFRTRKKCLYSPLSGVLDLKSLGKKPRGSYPIFNAKVEPSPKKILPPLRVVESISIPRYRLKELMPRYRSPGILLQS